MAKAKTATQNNQFDQAISIYQSLISKNPRDTEALVAMGYALSWNKNYSQSKEIFQRALVMSPHDHDALLGMIRALFWGNEKKEARVKVDAFLALYQGDSEGLELKQKIIQAQKGDQYWEIDLGYIYQNISFATDANGGNILVSYVKNKKWGIRAGSDIIDKFNDFAPAVRFGGTYWPDPKLAFSLDASLAPGQVVVPRQSYSILADYTLLPKLVTSLGYRFADYESVDVHSFSPSIQWYWNPRSDVTVKYSLSLTQLPAALETDHSFTCRAGWRPIDPLYLYAGYARTSESFDPGSLFSSTGRFTANHFLAGLKIETKYKINFSVDIDYENRNNATSVNTMNFGVQKIF